jgi:hypothetical protein
MDGMKDRAVLVKFADHAWRGGLIDRAVGDQIKKDAGAKVDTGHYWKRLVPKAAIRPRFNAANAARAFHISNTLPWLEGGVRILPVANFRDYMDGMRKLIAACEAEDRKFFKAYPDWIKEAERSHGKLFKAEQFPSLDEVKTMFSVEVDVIPLPNIADWRVDLDAEQVKALRLDAEQKMAAVQSSGIKELYTRLQELVEHAQKKLDDPEAVFRDSMIGNIKELVGLIAKLNVTGDKNLEAVRKETESKFAGLAPETLRTDPAARSKAAKNARAIMKKMNAYMGAGK